MQDRPLLAGQTTLQDGGFPDSVHANPRSIPDDVTIPNDVTAKHTTEENPLYLFDRWFHQNVDTLQQDWDVPGYFEDDLFSLLGEDHRLVRRCIETRGRCQSAPNILGTY